MDDGRTPIPVSDVVVPVEKAAADVSEPELLVQADAVLQQAEVQAEELLRQAQEESHRILENAQEEAAILRQQAYEEGHDSGYQDGTQQAKQEQAAALAAAAQQGENLVRQAKHRADEFLLDLDGVVSSLVQTALETLLQRELARQSADIGKLVREMLEFIVEQSDVEVRVGLEDFEVISEQLRHWSVAGFGKMQLKVVPDAEVSRGGCVIESAHGRADARMETRLELVEAKLTALIERGLRDELARLGATGT